MNRILNLASAIVALLLLAGAAPAAPLSNFGGTRADVRGFCTEEDYFLLEGGNFTLCITPVTDVVCRVDNVCWSSNLELALAAGFQRFDVALGANH